MATVPLSWREVGSGSPLLVLHGLLGNGANWQGPAQAWSARYRVLCLDLRNHGKSPHAAAMDYPALVADVQAFCTAQQLGPVSVLGHSLGGKVALGLALTAPALVTRLVVVDTAPVTFPDRHGTVLAALLALPLAELRDLRDAEARLAVTLTDPVMRAFALTNLKRGPHGYAWRVNLPALAAGLDHIRGFPADWAARRVTLPTLVVAGADSDYVDATGEAKLHACFTALTLVRLAGAGHWPHTQQPAAFLAAVNAFLGVG